MTFHTIGLFGHMRSQDISVTARAILLYLKKKQRSVFLEESLAASIEYNEDCPQFTFTAPPSSLDLAIVIGGDGALLSTARALAESAVPLLGVNRGSLGFLTDISPSDVEQKLGEILEGKFTIESRFLLEATTEEGNKRQYGYGLNEIVLSAQGAHHLIQYEIYVDKNFLCRQRADGLILATPTGSTAYALSGGGPILHPELNAVTLVPMFPHTLSMRPIVIHGDSAITLRIQDNINTQIQLGFDSQTFIAVSNASEIHIKKKEKKITLIHPLHYNYYKSLRSKLHWGSKLT